MRAWYGIDSIVIFSGAHISGKINFWQDGRLAQLVRARASHARGRRFEPYTAHHHLFSICNTFLYFPDHSSPQVVSFNCMEIGMHHNPDFILWI